MASKKYERDYQGYTIRKENRDYRVFNATGRGIARLHSEAEALNFIDAITSTPATQPGAPETQDDLNKSLGAGHHHNKGLLENWARNESARQQPAPEAATDNRYPYEIEFPVRRATEPAPPARPTGEAVVCITCGQPITDELWVTNAAGTACHLEHLPQRDDARAQVAALVEALKNIQNEAYEARGEWQGIETEYSPEWTHVYLLIIELAGEALRAAARVASAGEGAK